MPTPAPFQLELGLDAQRDPAPGRSLVLSPVDAALWPSIAESVVADLAVEGVPLRDSVVLVPHASLLPVARSAFAQRGGWQPRVDTVQSLAETFGPPPTPAVGSLSGDRVTDRLTAAALLQRQREFAAWRERDPRAFDEAVRALIETAHALRRGAQCQAPEARAAWWRGLREALPPVVGPGAAERQLARIALDWAALAGPFASDALWAAPAPAWVLVVAGGADPLAEALLAAASSMGRVTRRLVIDDELLSFAAAARVEAPHCVRADSLEDEAGAAAMAVLAAIDAGQAPVVLIAEDRLAVRRARALLDRTGVALADETGWTLSTTRAAGRLMAWLRAAVPGAGRDALVEAMKAGPATLRDGAVALEDAWRRGREPGELARRAERTMLERLAGWRGTGSRSLQDWLHSLAKMAPEWSKHLAADSAGAQLVAALRLHDDTTDEAWQGVAAGTPLDLAGFVAWVDRTLEDASFVPPAPPRPQVVVTPLARAAGRPFGAVVFPGADERHLGGAAPVPTLLPDAVAQAFGVATASTWRGREAAAFALLLRVPRVHLLRRTHDGDEPLGTSPWIDLLWQARRDAGRDVPTEQRFAPPTALVERRPLGRPAPQLATAAWPRRLSASTVDALRDCPYRFFARVGLGLREAVELEGELESRDYGSWMHALLHRFHQQRSGADDATELRTAADLAAVELGLDAAALLPFRAAFDAFAARYLEWLKQRDAQGWRYASGEIERRCAPPELDGMALEGRLDRIDRRPDGAVMVIDYKTGDPAKLTRRVKDRLEDTQLAFYALLLTDEPHEPPPRAIYLALRDRKMPAEIEHRDVAHSAALLLDGLARDLGALREGAGAAALGEGPACEFCAARGLCRRDHWSEA
jgi:ATP-dependent helicase/nuclease subunit B